MSKSIVPNKEVFQYAIRYLPTGRYLKKRPGYSFYETDIPSVYTSSKVAMKSLEHAAAYSRYKPEDCEIVKFRLIMEEVKEPTPEEIEYEKELKRLNMARAALGEIRWDEIESERGKDEVYRYVKHLGNYPISKGHSLHCYEEVYETYDGKYLFLWTNDQNTDYIPMSISRAIDYNWDEKIKELKLKYGIR